MNMAFFVQNNHVQFNTIPVSQYAWRNSIDVIDRSSYKGFDPMDCGVNWSDYDVVVPWGSVQFIRALLGTPLSAHLYYSENRFNTALWVKHFGELALNSKGRCIPVARVSEELLRIGECHVRPNSVDKAFNAALFNLTSWNEMLNERAVEPHLSCFIAPAAVIEAEYRCWIVGGNIIQISQYIRNGELNLEVVSPTSNIWNRAQALADIYLPEPVVVMDVVESNGQLLFLEFNAIHSSGWYAGDKELILDALVNWLTTKSIRDHNECID